MSTVRREVGNLDNHPNALALARRKWGHLGFAAFTPEGVRVGVKVRSDTYKKGKIVETDYHYKTFGKGLTWEAAFQNAKENGHG